MWINNQIVYKDKTQNQVIVLNYQDATLTITILSMEIIKPAPQVMAEIDFPRLIKDHLNLAGLECMKAK